MFKNLHYTILKNTQFYKSPLKFICQIAFMLSTQIYYKLGKLLSLQIGEALIITNRDRFVTNGSRIIKSRSNYLKSVHNNIKDI